MSSPPHAPSFKRQRRMSGAHPGVGSATSSPRIIADDPTRADSMVVIPSRHGSPSPLSTLQAEPSSTITTPGTDKGKGRASSELTRQGESSTTDQRRGVFHDPADSGGDEGYEDEGEDDDDDEDELDDDEGEGQETKPSIEMVVADGQQTELENDPVDLPSIATLVPGPREAKKLVFRLEVMQDPARARACGFGDKDKRPLTPSPILRLLAYQEDGQQVDYSRFQCHNLILSVELRSADNQHQRNVVMHPGPRQEAPIFSRDPMNMLSSLRATPGMPQMAQAKPQRPDSSSSRPPTGYGPPQISSWPVQGWHLGATTMAPNQSPDPSPTAIITGHHPSHVPNPLPVPSGHPSMPVQGWYQPQPPPTPPEQSMSRPSTGYSPPRATLSLPPLDYSSRDRHSSSSTATTLPPYNDSRPHGAEYSGYEPRASWSTGGYYHDDVYDRPDDRASLPVAGPSTYYRPSTTSSVMDSRDPNYPVVYDPRRPQTADADPERHHGAHGYGRTSVSPSRASWGGHPHPYSRPAQEAYAASRPSTSAIGYPSPYAEQPMSSPRMDGYMSDTGSRSGYNYLDRPSATSTYSRVIVGALHTGCMRLQGPDDEWGLFFFPCDLGVRTEGFYRLSYKVVDLSGLLFNHSAHQESSLPVLATGISNVFQVYSAKKFPGVPKPTRLTMWALSRGVRLPARSKKDYTPSDDGNGGGSGGGGGGGEGGGGGGSGSAGGGSVRVASKERQK